MTNTAAITVTLTNGISTVGILRFEDSNEQLVLISAPGRTEEQWLSEAEAADFADALREAGYLPA